MFLKTKLCERGLALAVILLVFPVVLVLGFGLASLSTDNLSHADASYYSRQAVFIAEAGVHQGLRALMDNPGLDQTIHIGEGETIEPQLSGVTAQVEVFNNLNGSKGDPATYTNGAVVPAGTVYIHSEGTARNNDFSRSVGVLLKAEVSGGPDFSQGAVFGIEALTINGVGSDSITDSFSSEVGPYGGSNVGSHGDIGTNDQVITKTGNQSKIDAAIEGDQNVEVDRAFSSVSIPDDTSGPDWSGGGVLSPGSYGNVSVSGRQQLELTSGVYVFDSLSVSGSANILVPASVSEPITIYVTGNEASGDAINLRGNSITNATGKPPLLQILAGPEVASASVGGTADAYFALYAPDTAVTILGTSDLYGAVVGATLLLPGTSSVHYDEALGRIDGGGDGGGQPRLISWQRI